MLFMVKGIFKPGAEAQRHAHHPQFSEHLAQHRPRVRLGGSVQDDAGERLGMVLLIEAADRAEAERFLANSPYTQAGLYERTEIERLELEVGSLG